MYISEYTLALFEAFNSKCIIDIGVGWDFNLSFIVLKVLIGSDKFQFKINITCTWELFYFYDALENDRWQRCSEVQICIQRQVVE